MKISCKDNPKPVFTSFILTVEVETIEELAALWATLNTAPKYRLEACEHYPKMTEAITKTINNSTYDLFITLDDKVNDYRLELKG